MLDSITKIIISYLGFVRSIEIFLTSLILIFFMCILKLLPDLWDFCTNVRGKCMEDAQPILSGHYHIGLLAIECILILEEVTLWFAVKLVFYPPHTHSTQHTGFLSVFRTDSLRTGLARFSHNDISVCLSAISKPSEYWIVLSVEAADCLEGNRQTDMFMSLFYLTSCLSFIKH